MKFEIFMKILPLSLQVSMFESARHSVLTLIAVLAIIFGLRPVSAATEQNAKAFVLCKSQKNVRTIRILPEIKDDNCTITYSKGGAEEVVGANRSYKTCQSILKSIQTNLEAAKWSCRHVGMAHLSTSSEISK